jgi:hypothetical protein
MSLSKTQVILSIAGASLAIFTGGFLNVHPYLPASTVAVAAVAQIAQVDIKQSEEREQGDLRTQLSIINLQIEILVDRKQRDGGLSPSDEMQLDLLIKQRDIILGRLKDIVT